MLRQIFFYIFLICCLNVKSQSFKNLPRLFDGLYSVKYFDKSTKDTLINVFKFFENNKLIKSTLTDQDINPDRLNDWFINSNFGYIYKWKTKDSNVVFKVNKTSFIISTEDTLFHNLSTYRNNELQLNKKLDYHPIIFINGKDFIEFPKEIKIGDILFLEIENYFCNGIGPRKGFKFEVKNDSIVQVKYLIYEKKYASVSKTKQFNSNKIESQSFLKRNEINLGDLYELTKKPIDIFQDVLPECLKLSFYSGYNTIDTLEYPVTILNQLEAFYNKIITESFDVPSYYIAGSGINYNLEFIRDKIGKYIIKNKKLKTGEETFIVK